MYIIKHIVIILISVYNSSGDFQTKYRLCSHFKEIRLYSKNIRKKFIQTTYLVKVKLL